MADLTPSELLQPSLLDRLTDDDPDSAVESRDARVMDVRRLKAAVLRDLEWLLNACAPPADDPIHRTAHARQYVLNYGLPDVTGLSAAGIREADLIESIARAVRRFEPRIIPRTLNVRALRGVSNRRPNVLVFEIEGEMYADPVPEALHLRTDLDLETGRTTLEEQRRG